MDTMEKMLKVVEADVADREWLVQPQPGYVLKFKDVSIAGLDGEERRKVFVNVCHCTELPPPVDDISQDELVRRLETGDEDFRVPLVIGELNCVTDRSDENAVQFNALVNSTFFEQRLAPKTNTVFRNFFAHAMADSVEQKHGLRLDPNAGIQLVNRKFVGEATPMRVAKKPGNTVIQEVKSTSKLVSEVRPEEVKAGTSKKKDVVYNLPPGEGPPPSDATLALIDDEATLEIRYPLKKVFKKDEKRDYKRISFKVNDDRVIVVWDEGRATRRTLVDVMTPIRLDPNSLKLKIEDGTLILTAPVIFD